MSRRAIVLVDGKPFAWRDLVAMRRAQMQPRTDQPPLFELREDHRPPAERSAASRYREPSLFDGLNNSA